MPHFGFISAGFRDYGRAFISLGNLKLLTPRYHSLDSLLRRPLLAVSSCLEVAMSGASGGSTHAPARCLYVSPVQREAVRCFSIECGLQVPRDHLSSPSFPHGPPQGPVPPIFRTHSFMPFDAVGNCFLWTEFRTRLEAFAWLGAQLRVKNIGPYRSGAALYTAAVRAGLEL